MVCQGFLGRSDTTNAVHGKLKLGRETIAHLEGHWDNKIILKDKQTGVSLHLLQTLLRNASFSNYLDYKLMALF